MTMMVVLVLSNRFVCLFVYYLLIHTHKYFCAILLFKLQQEMKNDEISTFFPSLFLSFIHSFVWLCYILSTILISARKQEKNKIDWDKDS